MGGTKDMYDRSLFQYEEEEGVGDQSMLRRSSRKAAITANEGAKVVVV